MAFRIKKGFKMCQNGHIYSEGCVLKFVENDLADYVEQTDDAPAEYMEILVNGVPTFVTDKKIADDMEIRSYSTTTDSVINNPELNPIADLAVDQDEPKRPVGRPKKS